jgi:RimJ/RimL family protein N-acetyltransferase
LLILRVEQKKTLIQLHTFTEQDFDRLIAWLRSAEDVMQFAGLSLQYPVTHLQLQEYLQELKREPFTVQYLQHVIGHCAITNADEQVAVLNHILIGDAQNRNNGFGTKIVETMLQKIFLEMNKTSAELYVFDWNANAIACYTKIGFSIVPNEYRIREVNGKTWRAVKMKLDKVDYKS